MVGGSRLPNPPPVSPVLADGGDDAGAEDAAASWAALDLVSTVGVEVGVGVNVGVAVGNGVGVQVGVGEGVAVGDGVSVGVFVGVAVAVAVGGAVGEGDGVVAGAHPPPMTREMSRASSPARVQEGRLDDDGR